MQFCLLSELAKERFLTSGWILEVSFGSIFALAILEIASTVTRNAVTLVKVSYVNHNAITCFGGKIVLQQKSLGYGASWCGESNDLARLFMHKGAVTWVPLCRWHEGVGPVWMASPRSDGRGVLSSAVILLTAVALLKYFSLLRFSSSLVLCSICPFSSGCPSRSCPPILTSSATAQSRQPRRPRRTNRAPQWLATYAPCAMHVALPKMLHALVAAAVWRTATLVAVFPRTLMRASLAQASVLA
jgi:hypothetical protein